MRWTDMSEKEILKAWAMECGTAERKEKYLPKAFGAGESYWCAYDGKGDIAEYGFETIRELKQIMAQELKEEFYRDLILPLSVAAFKEKKDIKVDTEGSGEDGTLHPQEEFSIPEFVYEF